MVVNFNSEIKKFISDFEKHERKNVSLAANRVKNRIKKKALKIKKTGNLAKGVYKEMKRYTAFGNPVAFVGTRAPAYHNYLVEYGHYARNGKKVEANPIVYPAFAESAAEVEDILSRPL